MNKFGRNYLCNIEGQVGLDANGKIIKDVITVQLPFTIEFDITRNSLASANVCQIRLYNLSQLHRNQIAFNATSLSEFRQVQLLAGYGSSLASIFIGNITQASSVREGVNFITTIECFDGGFAFVNAEKDWPGATFKAGTPLVTVIRTLMLQLPNVTIGTIGNFTDVLKRDISVSGNPTHILYELTGNSFYIDNGKAYALKTDEYVPSDTSANLSQPSIVISERSGLLNTPTLEQTRGRFEILFEPTLQVGRLVEIASKTNPNLNGTYKITSVKHRGLISGVMAGKVISIGEFTNFKEYVPAVNDG